MNTIISAVGIWFYSQSTNRYLYLIRNDPKHPDSWGLPGGKIESGERDVEDFFLDILDSQNRKKNRGF